MDDEVHQPTEIGKRHKTNSLESTLNEHSAQPSCITSLDTSSESPDRSEEVTVKNESVHLNEQQAAKNTVNEEIMKKQDVKPEATDDKVDEAYQQLNKGIKSSLKINIESVDREDAAVVDLKVQQPDVLAVVEDMDDRVVEQSEVANDVFVEALHQSPEDIREPERNDSIFNLF